MRWGRRCIHSLAEETSARRFGVEIDANRAEQAQRPGVETLRADVMDVRCPAEAVSLLYLNPPYDLETGNTGNQRLELVFLEHTYRCLNPSGVLIFLIPQPQLKSCARMLSEHFSDLTVYKLTDPASEFTERKEKKRARRSSAKGERSSHELTLAYSNGDVVELKPTKEGGPDS